MRAANSRRMVLVTKEAWDSLSFWKPKICSDSFYLSLKPGSQDSPSFTYTPSSLHIASYGSFAFVICPACFRTTVSTTIHRDHSKLVALLPHAPSSAGAGCSSPPFRLSYNLSDDKHCCAHHISFSVVPETGNHWMLVKYTLSKWTLKIMNFQGPTDVQNKIDTALCWHYPAHSLQSCLCFSLLVFPPKHLLGPFRTHLMVLTYIIFIYESISMIRLWFLKGKKHNVLLCLHSWYLQKCLSQDCAQQVPEGITLTAVGEYITLD